jgi:16S rRNA (cytosine967-C5)-methyltransferase
LRRNPDLKLRHTPDSVRDLAARQATILQAASHLVRPGGRLVYATCSFLPEENEDVVRGFLQRNANFVAANCGEILAAAGIRLDTGPFLRLRPDAHGADAFFAAVLTRGPPHLDPLPPAERK